jgi:polyhydroxyalkanoate synthesis repressor PhaR
METSAAPGPLQIRKYSNRRLYDATRSRHITADDLYQLVRDGHDVVVTDSATGADITHQVLTQMILERDSPKLEVFPTTLLHEIIRANQQMWRRFVEQWMSGLTTAISQQADAYARRVAEFGRRSFDASALGKMLAGALRSGDAPSERQATEEPTPDELHSALRELQDEVQRLGRQLAARSASRRKRRRGRA